MTFGLLMILEDLIRLTEDRIHSRDHRVRSAWQYIDRRRPLSLLNLGSSQGIIEAVPVGHLPNSFRSLPTRGRAWRMRR
jgi:hypothetical protein